MRVTWSLREPPLEPAAVLARGPVATALVSTLHARVTEREANDVTDGGSLARLRACAAERWLLVLGDNGDLPWVDGVTYLGWDGPTLAPTNVRADVPPFLIARAVRARSLAPADHLIACLPGHLLTMPNPVGPIDLGALGQLVMA